MARPISAEANKDLEEMDLLPRIHIMVDLSREKVRTQRTQYHMPNPAYWPKDFCQLSNRIATLNCLLLSYFI